MHRIQACRLSVLPAASQRLQPSKPACRLGENLYVKSLVDFVGAFVAVSTSLEQVSSRRPSSFADLNAPADLIQFTAGSP